MGELGCGGMVGGVGRWTGGGGAGWVWGGWWGGGGVGGGLWGGGDLGVDYFWVVW